MSYCEVVTYNIGQGLFSLLGEQNNNGTWFCALFDCGTSLDTSKAVTGPCIENAAKRIRDAGGLDRIVISHQDWDHWSLLWDLMIAVYGKEIDDKGCWLSNTLSPQRAMKVTDNSVEWCEIGQGMSYLKVDGEFEEERKIQYYNSSGTRFDLIYFTKNNMSYNIQIFREKEQYILLSITREDGHFSGKKYYNTSEDIVDTIRKICTSLELKLGKGICDIVVRQTRQALAELSEFSEEKIQQIVENAKEWTSKFEKNIEIVMGGAYCSCSYQKLKQRMQILGNVISCDSRFIKMTNGDYRTLGFGIHEGIESAFAPWRLLSIRKNATSVIVCYVTSEKKILLFPGDATVHVFEGIVEVMDNINIRRIDLMQAPHHGAFRTNYVTNKEGKPNVLQPFSTLLQKKEPKFVFISSYFEKYGHPHIQFVRDVCERAVEAPVHWGGECINMPRWGEKYEVEIVACDKAVYTTGTDGNLVWSDGEGPIEKDIAPKTVRRSQRKLPPDNCFVNRGRVNV